MRISLLRSVLSTSAVAAGLALSVSAHAQTAVLTFDNAAANAVATGPGYFTNDAAYFASATGSSATPTSSITEDGLVYAAAALPGSPYQHLYLSGGTGIPGNDLEGDGNSGGNGGTVSITAANGNFLKFESLNFAAFNAQVTAGVPTTLTGTTTVTGLLNGSVVASDTYTIGASAYSGAPFGSPYTNWTLQTAANLGNVYVDTLLITLNASASDSPDFSHAYWSAIDNVTVDVPEPAGILLLGASLAALAALRRVRR